MTTDEAYPGYPGWTRVSCGCCAGLEWGGIEPRTCQRCGGNGAISLHVASGTYAQYPGGPLVGRVVTDRSTTTSDEAEHFAEAGICPECHDAFCEHAFPPLGENDTRSASTRVEEEA